MQAGVVQVKIVIVVVFSVGVIVLYLHLSAYLVTFILEKWRYFAEDGQWFRALNIRV